MMSLLPKTEADLAEAVAGTTGPLRIEGGGTRPLGNRVEGEVLSVAGISGIALYEPGALTLVARAGTPLAEVETALAAEGQRLPFEPMDHRPLLGTAGAPTIGGVVAANVSGPRRIQAGACRDSLIGVRFVDGSGTVVKNGGRVMKNVTGYDLVKLMAGSRGTLGVLTEVAFKVLPEAESAATLTLEGLYAERAVQAMSAALGSPFEVTGAAHGPDGTLIRIEGFPDSVAYRAEKLRALLAPFGPAEIATDRAAVAALWAEVRDVTGFAGAPAVWRVSVRPGDAPGLLAELAARFAFETRLDWGGGLIWLAAETGDGAELHGALQEAVARIRGHATLVKGPDSLRDAVPVFQPEPAPLGEFSQRLRGKFDPRGILNPGLMG